MVAILRSSVGKSDVMGAAQWGQNLACSGTAPPQPGHGVTTVSLNDASVDVHVRHEPGIHVSTPPAAFPCADAVRACTLHGRHHAGILAPEQEAPTCRSWRYSR